MRSKDVKQVYVTKQVGERLKNYCKEEGYVMTIYLNKIVDEHLKSFGK